MELEQPSESTVLYDTLRRELVPVDITKPGGIGIYACGPTVYDRIHVGNARPFIVYSLLKRFLIEERNRVGIHDDNVVLVANITDVNDKIFAAALDRGVRSVDLAAQMTRHYVADTDRLGIGRPDHEPRVSAYISEIIDMIDRLIVAGAAYRSPSGDVYFSVESDAKYGALSNRTVADFDQGEGTQHQKHAPHDFALWKAAKPQEDEFWQSPWGPGRPGWHIECSAMAQATLGRSFDIHGGGLDLIFPHHENECAQSRMVNGVELANIWMHNGMLNMSGEKMAKSVGNVASLDHELTAVGRHAILLLFVATHYRQPLHYSPATIQQAQAGVRRLREIATRIRSQAHTADAIDPDHRVIPAPFLSALRSDFDTAQALVSIWEWVRDANRRLDAGLHVTISPLREMLHYFALDDLLDADGDIPEEVTALLHERREARRNEDWAKADSLRNDIERLGFQVQDGSDGDVAVRSSDL